MINKNFRQKNDFDKSFNRMGLFIKIFFGVTIFMVIVGIVFNVYASIYLIKNPNEIGKYVGEVIKGVNEAK